jgi:hypothetical protein
MKTIILIAVMLAPGLAAAQINKCIDSSGRTVGYAADCPAGTRAEQTNIKNKPSSTPAASDQKSLSERDAEFRKRQLEKKEASDKAGVSSAEADQRKRACEDSKAYLASLQAKQRIARTDPKTGERTFLDDADYPAETARAQKNVAEYCKS